MTKNRPNPSSDPQNADEAFLTLQIIASLKKHLIKVYKNEQHIQVEHKHERLLYLVFYLTLILIPLFLFKDNLKNMYPTLLIYYFFMILLIWNITRTTKKLIIDRNNRTIEISNLDVIGKALHPVRKFNFHELAPFETAFNVGKFGGTGKNIIQLCTVDGKRYQIFQIKSEGTGLSNGKMVCSALDILCN